MLHKLHFFVFVYKSTFHKVLTFLVIFEKDWEGAHIYTRLLFLVYEIL